MSMVCCLREVADSEIQGLLDDPESILELLDEEQDEIDLDKAWHGIHYLLTGSAWEGAEPLCYLVSGGETIGDVDVGYGPARALTSKQVVDFDAALSTITADELRRRFNPQAMSKAEIYPDIWERDPQEDDALAYLIEYFEDLKSFVEKTRAAGKGMIIYLT
jgi:hypothetical protein